MTRQTRPMTAARLMIPLSLCVLFSAGCSKPEEPAAPSETPVNRTGNPGGRNSKGAPRPIAASASGTEIMQAKCGCHGPGGKGGKAPVLVGSASSEDNLYKIIHDGKGKMPAFGTQLSEAQIKTVSTTITQLK